eukprot:353126-Chlamydomonas_euryale.AAC.1
MQCTHQELSIHVIECAFQGFLSNLALHIRHTGLLYTPARVTLYWSLEPSFSTCTRRRELCWEGSPAARACPWRRVARIAVFAKGRVLLIRLCS